MNMKPVLTLSGALLLAAASAPTASAQPFPAQPPFQLQLVEVTGSGCSQADVVSIQNNVLGDYYIDAHFYQQSGAGFASETNQAATTDRKDCTIRYNLMLAPGYLLDDASFEVDGEYDLSELGSASVSVRYNVPGVGGPSIAYQSYQSGSAPQQAPYQLTGGISVDDPRVNYCGAVIPLEIQVKATARQGRADQRDTLITVDNGQGETNVSRARCHVHIKHC